MTLTLGPVAAYNAICTLALAGSASSGYVFVARFTQWRFAAFAGGLFYGFGPYEIAQSSGHANLTFVVFPPLILLVVHEIVVRQRGSPRSWGIVLALLLTAPVLRRHRGLRLHPRDRGFCMAAAAIVGRRQIRSHIRYALVGAAWAVGLGSRLARLSRLVRVGGARPHQRSHPTGPPGLPRRRARPRRPRRQSALGAGWRRPYGDPFRQQPGGERLLPRLHAPRAAHRGRHPLLAPVDSRPDRRRRRTGCVRAVTGWRPGHQESTAGALLNGIPLPERIFTKLPLLKNTIPVRYSLYVELFAALLLGVRPRRRARRHRDRANTASTRSAAGVGIAIPAGIAAVGVPCLVAIVALAPVAPNVPFTAAIGPVGDAAVLHHGGGLAATPPQHRRGLSLSDLERPERSDVAGRSRHAVPDARWLLPRPAAAGQRDRLLLLVWLRAGDGHRRDARRPAHRTSARTDAGSPAPDRGRVAGMARPQRDRLPRAGTAHPAQAIAFLTALLGKPSQPEPGGGAAWYDVSVRTARPRDG